MNLVYFRQIGGATAGLVAAIALVGCNNSSTSSSANSSLPAARESPPAVNGRGNSGDHAAIGHAAMEHGSGGHAMGTRGIDALKTLRGKQFDIAFLSQMIAHHQAAVTMARQALRTASKPETKQEAQMVIDSQSKEIAQMTDWLKSWYDTTPSAQQQAIVNSDMQAMMEMPVTSDRMFYEMMIPHHQGAVDMSALVPERGARPELKTFAAQIAENQRSEIERYHQRMGHGG